jgi:hypothetical protein
LIGEIVRISHERKGCFLLFYEAVRWLHAFQETVPMGVGFSRSAYRIVQPKIFLATLLLNGTEGNSRLKKEPDLSTPGMLSSTRS